MEEVTNLDNVMYDIFEAIYWNFIKYRSLNPGRKTHHERCQGRRKSTFDNHLCFHGSRCVPNHDGEFYSCDCLTIQDADSLYEGVSCEFPATVFCNPGNPHDNYSFCTNNGTCQEPVLSSITESSSVMGEERQFCECPTSHSGSVSSH